MSHVAPSFPLSAGWRSLKRQIEADIESLRDRLEKQPDPIKSAEIRGEIRRARKVIAAVEGEKAPVTAVQIEDDGPLYA